MDRSIIGLARLSMASNDSGLTCSVPAEDQTEATAPLSAVTVAENDDLLSSILSRLEAKPLMSFKSVSKHWLSLISSPRFCRLHTLQNPNPKPSALFFPPHVRKDAIDYEFVRLDDHNPRSPPFGSLRLGPDPSSFQVLSSCNGLLLCSPWNKSSDRAYVFNPTTKQLSVLAPPSGGGSFSASTTRYSLAFDPSRSLFYKVVMARSAPGTTAIGGSSVQVWSGPNMDPVDTRQMFEIHIYSSETRSWKKHEPEIEWPGNFYMFDQGIYSNGSMHWAAKKEGFMCFDINRECTRPMPEPPGYRGWVESAIRYLGQSGGDLHLVDIQGYDVMEMDVYVLERDYSKWSRKYRVDMNVFSRSYPRMISSDLNPLDMEYYNFSVLSLLQVDGNNGDEQLVLHVTGKVISYSFKSKSIRELRRGLRGKVDRRPVYRLRSFDGHLYSDTLACA